jgi:hypothetical protein
MKYKKYSFILLMAASVVACKGKDKEKEPASSNAMDAARNFIRATLDGKFDFARDYMLIDSLNVNYLDIGNRSRQNADQATKDSYRGASILFHKTIPVNDSVSVIIYSNSFKNDHDTLRLVKMGNDWKVDLKYLFDHDADSSLYKIPATDTLK